MSRALGGNIDDLSRLFFDCFKRRLFLADLFLDFAPPFA